MTKDQILAALPKLKHEELAVVYAMAQHLLGAATGQQNQKATTLAALCHDALSGALNLSMSHPRLAGTKWGIRFNEKVPELAQWLDLTFPGWSKNKVGQIAFLRMIFDLLSDDLKQRKLPRSFGVAVANLDRIPKIIENAFPNYIEAGLAPLILKNFQ